MASKTPALQDLTFLANRLQGILSLKDDLAKLDSLENAIAEHTSRKADLEKATAAAHAQLQLVEQKIAAAEKQLVAELNKAKLGAEAVAKAAKEKADAAVAEATAQGRKIIQGALASKAQVEDAAAKATAELKVTQAKVAAAITQHTEVTNAIAAVKAKL